MKKERLWTPQFILLVVVALLNAAAGHLTITLVSKYAIELGADLTLASTIAGLMSMVSLFVCPFAGALADKFSRKWILVIANLGYGACLIGHAFCTTTTALIVMRLLTGVFFSVTSVVNIAFAANYVSKERMGEGLGYVTLAMIVAQAFGPSIGIWMLEASGFGLTFISAGISAFLCMLAILAMPDLEKGKTKVVRKIHLKDLYAVEFTAFMLMAMLFSSGNGLVSTYLKLIAEERGIENIALFFTVYSACMLILRPITGKLLDKKGVFIILIPSFVFAAAGMAFVGIGSSLGMMLAAAVFKALGQGNGTPSMQAYCVKTLDKSRSGVAASTIMIGQNVGNAIAPIIGSFFVTSYGYEPMFLGSSAIILLGGLLLIYICYKKDQKRA